MKTKFLFLVLLTSLFISSCSDGKPRQKLLLSVSTTVLDGSSLGSESSTSGIDSSNLVAGGSDLDDSGSGDLTGGDSSSGNSGDSTGSDSSGSDSSDSTSNGGDSSTGESGSEEDNSGSGDSSNTGNTGSGDSSSGNNDSSTGGSNSDNTGNNSGDNNSTGSHSIQLLSYIIDTNNNTSLYEYYITSGTAPSISHWTLGFADGCGSGSIVNNSSDVSVTWTNSDPTTGTRGIKFDNGYEDGEARTITILLNGIYPVGSTTYSIKAGTNVENGEINGPTCQTNVEPPVVQTNTLTVQAFMDSNGNGTLDEGELSLDQVIIKVYDSNGNLVGEAATSSDGEVEFDLPAGNYTVVYSSVEGLILANNNISVNLTENVVVSNSYELDKDYLFGKTANGFTIGFWKNNISKALAGRTGGTQIDASTLQSYVEELSTFLLDPLNFQNLTQAYNTLSSTSSSPVALLEKQLTGSEFNYQNGAYIGGNSTYTKYFLYQGEFMSKYNSQFSSDEIIEMKDLYDAYNNSHGGEITPL